MVNTLEQKNEIAQEYIKKISKERHFDGIKKIDESLSLFKKDIEQTGLSKKIEKNLQDFLVSENIFEGMGDKIKSNFSSIFFLSQEGKQEIEKAKNVINSNKTEQEIRQELGLQTNTPENQTTKKNNKENKNTTNQNIDIVSLSADENYINQKCIEYGVTDQNQIAYVLATVKGECNFQNTKEVGGEDQYYGQIDSETRQRYYGRGFVQLTHKENYQKFNNIIKFENLKFKDNNGNNILNIDIVNNPDQILQSNDLAAFILVRGMKEGLFTGKKLNDYIYNGRQDFEGARQIVNGNDKKNKFAQYANNYLTNIDNYSQAA